MNAIVDTVLTLVLKVFEIVFNLLFFWVNLPEAPQSLTNTINNYLNMIFSNLDLLSFFVNVDTLHTIFKLFIFVFIFKYTLKLIMFVVHKIPDVVQSWTQMSLFK